MSHAAPEAQPLAETQSRRCAPSNGSALRRENIWNGWTNNYRPSEDGYITHACVELRPQYLVPICGSGEIQETGMLTLADGWQPRCFKCRKKLIKLGLIPPNAPGEPRRERDENKT